MVRIICLAEFFVDKVLERIDIVHRLSEFLIEVNRLDFVSHYYYLSIEVPSERRVRILCIVERNFDVLAVRVIVIPAEVYSAVVAPSNLYVFAVRVDDFLSTVCRHILVIVFCRSNGGERIVLFVTRNQVHIVSVRVNSQRVLQTVDCEFCNILGVNRKDEFYSLLGSTASDICVCHKLRAAYVGGVYSVFVERSVEELVSTDSYPVSGYFKTGGQAVCVLEEYSIGYIIGYLSRFNIILIQINSNYVARSALDIDLSYSTVKISELYVFDYRAVSECSLTCYRMLGISLRSVFAEGYVLGVNLSACTVIEIDGYKVRQLVIYVHRNRVDTLYSAAVVKYGDYGINRTCYVVSECRRTSYYVSAGSIEVELVYGLVNRYAVFADNLEYYRCLVQILSFLVACLLTAEVFADNCRYAFGVVSIRIRVVGNLHRNSVPRYDTLREENSTVVAVYGFTYAVGSVVQLNRREVTVSVDNAVVVYVTLSAALGSRICNLSVGIIDILSPVESVDTDVGYRSVRHFHVDGEFVEYRERQDTCGNVSDLSEYAAYQRISDERCYPAVSQRGYKVFKYRNYLCTETIPEYTGFFSRPRYLGEIVVGKHVGSQFSKIENCLGTEYQGQHIVEEFVDKIRVKLNGYSEVAV